jgi:beta-glucosidase
VPAGGTTTVTWHLDRNDVGFYDNSGHFVVEPGTIEVYVGDSSDAGLKDTFTVQ